MRLKKGKDHRDYGSVLKRVCGPALVLELAVLSGASAGGELITTTYLNDL